MLMSHPDFAKAIETALPIPLSPPLIIATLSFNLSFDLLYNGLSYMGSRILAGSFDVVLEMKLEKT